MRPNLQTLREDDLRIGQGQGSVNGPTGWVPSDLRLANQWSIYSALFDGPVATVPELASLLDVTKPTITTNLAGLEDAGLIRRSGVRTGSAGRAPQLYQAVPSAGWIVAVEIGRQWLRAALADLSGKIRQRIDLPTKTAERTLSVVQLAEEIEGMLKAHNIDSKKNIVSVVVASPGVYLKSKKKFYHNASLPVFSNEQFIDELRTRLGVPVRVENDANMAAVGELSAGSGKGLSTFVYVHVGVGVGLGVVVKGSLHRGAHGAAGEPLFMHVHSAPTKPADPAASYAASDDDDVVAFARLQGDTQVATAAEIFARAMQHDRVAEDVLDREVEYLAELLLPSIAMLDPEAIVFGGIVGDQLGSVLPALSQRLAHYIPLAGPRFEVGVLGPDATVRGGIDFYLTETRRAAFERSTHR